VTYIPRAGLTWDEIKSKLETEGAKNKAYDIDNDGLVENIAFKSVAELPTTPKDYEIVFYNSAPMFYDPNEKRWGIIQFSFGYNAFDNNGGGLWTKYINIPITTSPSEYAQYKVVIDSNNVTVYSADGTQKAQGAVASDFWANVKSDGSDIRVFNQDKEQRYFWIEEFDYNNKKAIILVKVEAGDTELNIAYGNPNALQSDYEDPTKIFYSLEDFDTLDNWIVSGATLSDGVVKIDAGNYYIQSKNVMLSGKAFFRILEQHEFNVNYHMQTITKLGDYFYVALVDTDNNKAYIYKLDSNFNIVAEYDVTRDTRYHVVAERDYSGNYILLAIAENTPSPTNPTIIARMYPDGTIEDLFTVNDHIGAICSDGNHIYMFNWDANTLYVYDYNGNLITSKSKTGGGWGYVQDCYYHNGYLYCSEQDDSVIYKIDVSTLTTVEKYKIEGLSTTITHEGMDIDPSDSTILYFAPDDGYIYVAKFVEGSFILEYKVKQGGNTKRNIGISASFPCENSNQNHIIEHSHDGQFELEVLSADASTPYQETSGTVSTDWEVHKLMLYADKVILRNSATIEITSSEAGVAYPNQSVLLPIGFQTWGTADSPLYVDWVRVLKLADPADFGTPQIKTF